MSEKINQSLEGVSETLLLTLYARARESQRPDGLLKDEQALALVERLDADFSRLQRMQRQDDVLVVMRTRRFDQVVRCFLERNPAGIVVHIGCGLDSRFERVDNQRVVWFDLDLPDVIALRQKLLPNNNPRYHTLAASVFEDDWLEEVRRFKAHPCLFISEGVLLYFEEEQVKSLFIKLRENFPGSELVCDAHTPFVIRMDNLHMAFIGMKARLHWGIKSGREVETYSEGIHLLDEWNYYEDADSPFKRVDWVPLLPDLLKSSGVFHYLLGIQV